MRIISGSAKGRVLNTPAGITRPTSDRAREGIFSALESEIGTCEGISFLDLYGGTGAVGLEALSRGASEVVVVEKDVKAAQVARDNYELIRAVTTGKFSVMRMSVDGYLALAEKPILADVVYLDPPYELANSVIEKVLTGLGSEQALKRDAIVIVERSSRTKAFTWPDAFEAIKERKYGEGTGYFANF